MMPIKLKKLASIAGLIGCLIILTCVAISIAGFIGEEGESYNLGNHFISELGAYKVSARAAVFNGGMIGSSILLSFFGIGFSLLFNSWKRWAMLTLCLITGLSCAFVGLLPVDDLQPHLIAAGIFFHSALATVLLSSAITFFEKQPAFPKWTIGIGILTVSSFAAFVLWPNQLVREWARDPAHFVRPDFWWHTTLEWACFFSIILWMMTMAILMQQIKPIDESR